MNEPWRRQKKEGPTKEELLAMQQATSDFYRRPPRWLRRVGIGGTPRAHLLHQKMAIPKGR